MKKLFIYSAALLVAGACIAGVQSKYNAGEATGIDVNFGPSSGPTMVKSILASSANDTTTYLSLYARTGSGENLTAAATNGTFYVYVDNADSQFASNDVVVLVYNDGVVDDYVCSTVTASNVLLTVALSQAATTDSRLYEVSAQGKIVIGTTAFNESGDVLFATPSDSPLRVVAVGTNTAVTVTVLK